MAIKLTAALVRDLEPTIARKGAKQEGQTVLHDYHDAGVPGLILRVRPSGRKTFVLQYERGRRINLGDARVMTLEAARVKARRMLAETDQHGAPRAASTGVDPRLDEFLEQDYAPHATQHLKDGKAQVARLNAAFKPLMHHRLTELDAALLSRWRTGRLKATVSAGTINRDVNALRGLLKHALEQKAIPEHPFDGTLKPLKQAEGRTRHLAPAERKKLMDAAHVRDQKLQDHLLPMLVIALNTGLRRGELTSITWDDVDMPRAQVTLRGANTKSSKTRVVPLNTEAVKAFKLWASRVEQSGRCFPFRSIKTAWRKLLLAAGVQDFRWHDARHDFASELAVRGVPLYSVEKLLGHASGAMTRRYAHLADEALRSAVRELQAPTKRRP